uniref:CSON011384 protein n=2 Tax=Culicoides sonorensis TaxID=179676 RepID=A0A336N439_CULSO
MVTCDVTQIKKGVTANVDFTRIIRGSERHVATGCHGRMKGYIAIINPLKPRMGKRTTLCIAAGIWIVGIILSCPMLLFFTTFDEELKNGEIRIVCYAEWPDGPTNHSMIEYALISQRHTA